MVSQADLQECRALVDSLVAGQAGQLALICVPSVPLVLSALRDRAVQQVVERRRKLKFLLHAAFPELSSSLGEHRGPRVSRLVGIWAAEGIASR